jgi:hypothetical protein
LQGNRWSRRLLSACRTPLCVRSMLCSENASKQLLPTFLKSVRSSSGDASWESGVQACGCFLEPTYARCMPWLWCKLPSYSTLVNSMSQTDQTNNRSVLGHLQQFNPFQTPNIFILPRLDQHV